MTIATIGYEKSSLEDFIATLLTSQVQVLVDVRQLPLSRRKGFSKRALGEALNDAGIEYVHLKGLGDPKEGRDAAKAGNHGEFLRIFAAHMKTKEFKAAIERVIPFAEGKKSCLMCYERDPEKCHRKLVGEALSGIIGANIKHLDVPNGRATSGARNKTRKISGSSEGLATGR
jgi:uncharacterized protein (DUF488 family)